MMEHQEKEPVTRHAASACAAASRSIQQHMMQRIFSGVGRKTGCYLRCFYSLNDAKVVGEVLSRRVLAGNALGNLNVRRVWIQHALCGRPASRGGSSLTAHLLLAGYQLATDLITAPTIGQTMCRLGWPHNPLPAPCREGYSSVALRLQMAALPNSRVAKSF